MGEQYTIFVNVLGALGKLVVAATIVERVLAFIFEHKWFVLLLTKEMQVTDSSDPTKQKIKRVSKIPGLKGLLALTLSLWISFQYRFDILDVVFVCLNSDCKKNDPLGMVVTGFVIAGGSAGAITIFQSYLDFGKKSRDAIAEARIAEAESRKQIAELNVMESQAKLEKAEEEKEIAQARKRILEQSNNPSVG